MTNKECPICLDVIINKFKITTPCKHVYCLKCFMEFYETKCPLCRRELKDKIPGKMLDVIQKNTMNEPAKKSLNIHNRMDFPPLGT
jgi:hypothetical protein